MAKPKKSRRKKPPAGRNKAPANVLVTLRQAPTGNSRQLPLSEAMALAATQVQNQRIQHAQAIYNQILSQHPDISAPAIELLKCLHAIGNLDAAQLMAYRMQATFKDDAKALAAVARFYNLKGEADKALDILNQALGQCEPASCDILYRYIGSIRDSQGDTERAIDCYRQALAVNGSDVIALYSLAKLQKTQAPDALLETLLAIEQSGQAHANEQPYLYFALAYLYEAHDQARYFDYLTRANDLVKQDSGAYFNDLTRSYDIARKHPGESAPRRQPALLPSPIFIIAPPRSGTTLLEQILGAHPQTQATGESGALIAAINQALRQANQTSPYWTWDAAQQQRYFATIETQYFNHDRLRGIDGKVAIDKSLDNFQHLDSIVATWPDARIIHLRRHPLDTILSCYHQFFGTGYNRFFDLQALAHYYVAVERFMTLWRQRFSDHILTVDYEQLVSDQEVQTRNMLSFCRLTWNDQCLDFHNTVGTVLTVSNRQVRQPLYQSSVAKWRDFVDQLKPAITILERELDLTFDI